MNDSKLILDERGMAMVLSRMAYEILERNAAHEDLVLVGIRTRGVFLAQRLQALLNQIDQLDVQLLVLVDRGHRELPIMPDYVGKHVPSSPEHQVKVRMREGDNHDSVTVSYAARRQVD
jgi:pyrimidine operon attenuation protein/uracil phosphoribosyltransferase